MTGDRQPSSREGADGGGPASEPCDEHRSPGHEIFDASADGAPEWYLYVVEKTDDGYQVLPVANPVRVAAKWILCGGAWRMLAEGHGAGR